MKITQIRSATNRLVYAGKTFLIDPWLSPRHAFSFADIPGHPFHIPDPMKEYLPMPFYDLPVSVREVLQDVDYIIVTHLHPDHIDMSVTDGTAGAPLDKTVPIFCQNEEDAAVLKKFGFQDITILPKEGIKIGDAPFVRFLPSMARMSPAETPWASSLKPKRKKHSIWPAIPSGMRKLLRPLRNTSRK